MRLPATPVAIACVALPLVGCAVGPDFHAPAAPASTRFTETPVAVHTVSAATPGGNAQRLIAERDIPGDWWALFARRKSPTW